jgi:hypothetical protein
MYSRLRPDRKHRICTATLSARRCAIWGFRANTRPTAFGECCAPSVASGLDIDVLEAQLVYAKRGDVQKAYDRTTFDDDRRRVMQEWADYVDNCVRGRK